jgi:hypothetical protein
MTEPHETLTVDLKAECPETWLARRLFEGKPAETWIPVPRWYYEQIGLPVPAVPHQVSDQGRIRKHGGEPLRDRPNGRPQELPPWEQYRIINLSGGGQKKTVLVSHVVLAGHCPEARDGRETRHLGKGDANRAWNWYPEGVAWGDARENAFDKPPEVRSAAAAKARAAQTLAGTAKPPRPVFPCRNQARARCLGRALNGGLVLNEGSRCFTCAVQVGKDATVLLGLGMPSQAVGEFFGHTSGEWVVGLAVKHGGYTGGGARARMQRPTLRQRIRLVLARWGMRGHPK